MSKSSEVQQFKKTVWNFYKQHGRHDLPWRKSITPYKILVSEIMLQQTQVDRVIPKYKSFLKAFPSFTSLAQASKQDVLKHWVGLGYNNRALRLQQTAQEVTRKYAGKLPKDFEQLVQLPGIGPYTAGAVCAFAYNTAVPIIETNIRTVFIYHFFQNKKTVTDKEIMDLVTATLDLNNPREWYWALMDYGASLKKLHGNLARKSSSYTKQSQFQGSIRQIRGVIIRLLSEKKRVSIPEILQQTKREKTDVLQAIADLQKDQVIVQKKDFISLS